MISGGNATVFVSNMDAAVRFYTQVLGLRLTNRFGDNWATGRSGPGSHHRAASGFATVSRSGNQGRHDAGTGNR
jgi:catechol 2,3-dioxygenase-like lactoylglutathione lyase family enzyme